MSPISSTLANASAYGYRTFAAAAAGAYESIATVTPSGSTNTVTFSSIPSTYASLQLRIIVRGTANAGTTPLYLRVRANGDTTSTYPYYCISGLGTGISAVRDTTATAMILGLYADSGYASNIFGITILDIHNYASTTQNKTFRSFSGVDNNTSTGGELRLSSGLWMTTSAINSLTIINNGGDNYSSSSSFALYGIKGA
jgi:hypothetical protein